MVTLTSSDSSVSNRFTSTNHVDRVTANPLHPLMSVPVVGNGPIGTYTRISEPCIRNLAITTASISNHAVLFSVRRFDDVRNYQCSICLPITSSNGIYTLHTRLTSVSTHRTTDRRAIISAVTYNRRRSRISRQCSNSGSVVNTSNALR